MVSPVLRTGPADPDIGFINFPASDVPDERLETEIGHLARIIRRSARLRAIVQAVEPIDLSRRQGAKTAIELLSLLLAELGSWCCVQPVVARLPDEQFVAAEQGMLRTFGRIMPVLMRLSAILAVALIILSRGDTRFVFWLRIAAACCIAVTVVTTLLVNVPINTQTASWQLTNDPSAWQQMRERWHFFQSVARCPIRRSVCAVGDSARVDAALV